MLLSRRWSLARQMLLLQLVVVGATVIGGGVFDFFRTRNLLTAEAARTSRAVAISVAESPSVLAAFAQAVPSATLQPYAEEIQTHAGVNFITIMSPEGRRYTHPNPAQIGGHYIGSIAQALAGQTYTETATGTLGPSVRTITPVRDAAGRVRGMVAAGITIEHIDDEVRGQLMTTGLGGLLGLFVGVGGTWLVSARLRRQTHGLGPTELDRMYAERSFVDSLRSAAHESANRLHTVISLIELGRSEDAVAFATRELASAQRLADHVVGAVREPVLAALLLGKSAEAAERGVELVITPEGPLGDLDLDGALDPGELVTIVGNLIDNAIDAAVSGPSPAWVEVGLDVDGPRLLLRVHDSGPGMPPKAVRRAFERGWTTKGTGRGFGLPMVEAAVHRLGGAIEVHGSEFSVRLPLP
ncbi:GHKL domain-containing protein [Streptosporangiaceae bacterium NEAU-GS5]|nr:GHKL domain-containing protein [Streptosporangiaceae bacterium NEAU-GS5]